MMYWCNEIEPEIDKFFPLEDYFLNIWSVGCVGEKCMFVKFEIKPYKITCTDEFGFQLWNNKQLICSYGKELLGFREALKDMKSHIIYRSMKNQAYKQLSIFDFI